MSIHYLKLCVMPIKYIVFTFLAIFFCLNFYAQSPEGFNYQAVLRQSNGNISANNSVGIKIQLRLGSPSGSIIYAEKHFTTTNAQGLINIVIGNGQILQGNFSTVNWGTGPYYIKTFVDFSGGTNFQGFGSQQLLSVPYALYLSLIHI